MDCNQNFQNPETRSQCNDESALEAKCSYAMASGEDPESSDVCYDCNICLDPAHDPVVTLCGHLYCWACIFEWLHVQTTSSEPFPQPKSCPVCKASISHTSLVPLYGRGSSPAEQEEKRSRLDLYIPPRSSLNHLDPDDLSLNPTTPVDSYEYSPRNVGTSSSVDPAQVMIGELFYTRILWSFMGFFTDPSHGRRTRMRRQEMQADKSLNRVSIFLFCCLILCLLTF